MRLTRHLVVCAVFLIAASALLFSPTHADASGDAKYTPDQIQSTSAEVFLERMQQSEPGYHQFAGMWALTEKAKQSDADARKSMLSLIISVMKDKSRNVYQRWQCCYVISGSGDERGVPDLIQVLLNDPSELMRSVAAEAVASFPKNAAAHDALLQSARTETSPRVRAVLNRRVGAEMPGLEPIIATDAQRNSAQALLQQVWKAESGKPKFDAIDSVAKTCKASDLASKRVMISMFISAMKDKSRDMSQRWPFCYVILRSGDDQGVPDVIDALFGDQVETMRAVAAEALGQLGTGNPAAREAMMRSARTETAKAVRDVLARYLAAEMPELEPR